MFKHILYFETSDERDLAEVWLKGNFELEDFDTDDDCYDYETGTNLYQYIFYTSVNISEVRQLQIVDTVKPVSYLVNEL